MKKVSKIIVKSLLFVLFAGLCSIGIAKHSTGTVGAGVSLGMAVALTRSVNRTVVTTNDKKFAAWLAKQEKAGVQRLASFGSQIPEGGIFDAIITGKRGVELYNPNTQKDECIALYLLDVDLGNGKMLHNESVIANESANELLPVGTKRKIESFVAGNGRKYNQFVEQVKVGNNAGNASQAPQMERVEVEEDENPL